MTPAAAAEAPSLDAMVTDMTGSMDDMMAAPEPQAKSLAEALAEALAEVREVPLEEGWEVEAEVSRLQRKPTAGNWYRDDKNRVYFLSPFPKDGEWIPYAGQWSSSGQMIQLGIDGEIYEVAGEDEERLYLVVYRPTVARSNDAAEREAREEAERLSAAYAVETRQVNRVSAAPFSTGLPQEGQWRNGFDLADMNGDGHLDIVHGPPRRLLTNRPVVFLHDGAGTWRVMDATYPSFPYDYGAATADDFNGDGRQDIALGIHLRGVTAMVATGTRDGITEFDLYNEGLEFFSPMPQDNVGSEAAVFSSRTLTTADWDGDGRPDILALGEGPRPATDIVQRTRRLFDKTSFGLRVYLNRGEDGWQHLDIPREQRTVFGDAVTTGDFDGDGRVEAFVGNNVISLRSLLVGHGAGERSLQLHEVPEVRPMAIVHAVAAGDFNGDGRDDVAVAFLNREPDIWRSGIDILYSREGGWERRPLIMREERKPWTALATGDVDGDGALDLAALDRSGHSYLFLGDGQGFFSQEQSLGIEPPGKDCAGYHVALADLDGDGRDELVEAFAGEVEHYFAPDRCPKGGALRAWDFSLDG